MLYYKYNFDKSNKKLSVIEVTKTDLGGCFCITNSCNYGGFTQNIADKYKYNGIGMIDHTDKEKRVNLDKAVEYICKDEQVVKSSDNSKTVAYTRGNMPKKKSNAGRPRNEK